jgi:hypothetical protein
MTRTNYSLVPTRRYVERAGVCLGLVAGGLALIHGWKLFGPVPDAATGIGFTLLFIGAIASVINVAGLFFFIRKEASEIDLNLVASDDFTYSHSLLYAIPSPYGSSVATLDLRCARCNRRHKTVASAIEWHRGRRNWLAIQPAMTTFFSVPVVRYLRHEDQFIEDLQLAMGVVSHGESE